MRWRPRRVISMGSINESPGSTSESPLVSVVVPVYNVAAYLPECIDSLLAQAHRNLEIVVVDDGATDESGAIADAYAEREPRVRVVHTANQGLGAARNVGLLHVSGQYVAFADSDDVVPPDAYATLVATLERTGSDLVAGSVVRWESDGLHEPPWERRLHTPARLGITADEHPEILGDVFAWNKLYRLDWWRAQDLIWPEGLRYEDQPTTTRAFLQSTFDVIPDVVYHWRIRDDGSSITQQRASLQDLRDRWETKRLALAAVEASPYADQIGELFLDLVLAGDLHRYFVLIPYADDEWWALLRDGVREFWGARSLTNSGLTPVHRLTGWLVEQDRRTDAAAVMAYVKNNPGPLPRVSGVGGQPQIEVPGVTLVSVDPLAVTLRQNES